MNISKEIQNTTAINKNGETVFIKNAESGRKGYYCRGCNKEMEAVKRQKPNRTWYFRHCSKNVQNENKCTYSDETYRHKLAKEFFQFEKKVKLPPIYKYPPKGINGLPNLIDKSKIIHADKVEVEKYFYLNDNGILKWGKSEEVDVKNHIIKPDVIFFNQDYKPILFIELAATHKVDNEKQAKIKMLKINTIEIVIPKESLEEIENALKSIKNTKWLYNDEEENFEYRFLPDRNNTGIQESYEIQRRLFEESFQCRKARINNLIREISKHLQRESYSTELSRVRDSLEREGIDYRRVKEQLQNIRRGIEKRVRGQYNHEENEIDTGRKEIERRRRDIEEKYNELEGGYHSKKSEIRRKEVDIKGNIDEEERIIDKEERDIEDPRSEIATRGRRVEELTRKLKIDIGRIVGEIDDASRRTIQLREYEKYYRLEYSRTETTRIEEEIKRVERATKEQIDDIEKEGNRIREKYEAIRREILESIETGSSRRDSPIRQDFIQLLPSQSDFIDSYENQINIRRIREARKCISEGTYKNWNL